MNSHPFTRPALLALSLGLLASGCRGGEGKPCRQAEDCQDGLVCVVNGMVLQPGAIPTTQAGECSEDDMLPNSETSVEPPPTYDDLPSARDLGVGETGDGDGDTTGDGDGDTTGDGDGDTTGDGDGDTTGDGDGDGDGDTTGDGDGDTTGDGDGDGDTTGDGDGDSTT